MSMYSAAAAAAPLSVVATQSTPGGPCVAAADLRACCVLQQLRVQRRHEAAAAAAAATHRRCRQRCTDDGQRVVNIGCTVRDTVSHTCVCIRKAVRTNERLAVNMLRRISGTDTQRRIEDLADCPFCVLYSCTSYKAQLCTQSLTSKHVQAVRATWNIFALRQRDDQSLPICNASREHSRYAYGCNKCCKIRF